MADGKRVRVVLVEVQVGQADDVTWALEVHGYGPTSSVVPLLERRMPDLVLIRPDGYVAWVGEGTDQGLHDALTTWCGPPTAL